MPLYNTSPVQKRIFQQHWETCLLNYVLFRIDQSFLLSNLETRWQVLVNNHDILKTNFEYRENFKHPFQNVANEKKASVVVRDCSDLNEFAIIDEHKKSCIEVTESIQLIAFVSNGQVKYLGIASPITLLDTWSIHCLIHLLIEGEGCENSNKEEETLQFAQYLEWLESLTENSTEIPAELVNLWTVTDSKKVSNQNLQSGDPIENWENYKSIDLVIPSEFFQQVAATLNTQSHELLWMAWRFLLNKHYNEQKWQSAWVSSGRQFEEFRQILGPFSKSIPLNIIEESREYSQNLASWSDKLELLESYREYFNHEMDSQIFSHTAIEYLNHDLFPSEWHQNKITVIDSLSCSEPASLKLIITEKEQLCKVSIQFNSTAFHKDAAQAIASQFQQLIVKITESGDISQFQSIELADTKVKTHLLESVGRGKIAQIPYKSMPDLFSEASLKNPDKISISYNNQTISYQTLYRNSWAIADILITQYGIKSGDIVAIHLRRSDKLIKAIWAVMMSGATYIPIDTEYPESRINHILKNSNANLLISDTTFSGDNNLGSVSSPSTMMTLPIINTTHIDTLIEKSTKVKSPCSLPQWKPDQIVYVIYTSGTTGNPKGCKISMSNLLHYVKWTEGYYFTSDNTGNCPLFTSIAFDLTVTSIFSTLSRGATLYIASEEESVSEHLQKIFDGTAGVDTVKLTPSHIRLLPHLSISECKILTCIIGGEALLPHDVEILRSINSQINIYNEYGPTECTVGCIVWKVPEKFDTILIGKPIDNSSVCILNNLNQICPVGIVGEIHIGGKTVGAGYLGNPQLTSEKFIPSPFDPAVILYKTGDLGYWTVDGDINFIGRNDLMVKIRGYRIELEEISDVLRMSSQVRDVYITTIMSAGNTPEIIAYYIPTNALDNNTDLLFKLLQKELPSYMIPAHILPVEVFPLTIHGKLDRDALPTPEEVNGLKSKTFVAPGTPQQKLLADIWQQVLHRPDIGISDHFLSIGGDSIKAIQVVSRLREYDLQVSVRDILVYPTIAELALHLNKNTVYEDKDLDTGSLIPLTAIQYKFFKDCQNNSAHYNQSILLGSKNQVNAEKLEYCIDRIWQHHAMLRAIYSVSSDEITQQVLAADTKVDYFVLLDGTAISTEQETNWVIKQTAYWQQNFKLDQAPLFRCLLLRFANHDLVFLVSHHLIIDGVSWRILLGDLTRLYDSENAEQIILSPSASFKQWSLQLQQKAALGFSETEEEHWQNIEQALDKRSMFNDRYTEQVHQHYSSLNSILSIDETNALLSMETEQVSTQGILLTALSKAFYLWKNSTQTIMYLESHGRNAMQNSEIFSSTVGWFTTKYPFQLNYDEKTSVVEKIHTIQNSITHVPNNGSGYLLNKYSGNASALTADAEPHFTFNYLGQLAIEEDQDFYIHPLTELQENIGGLVYIQSLVLFSLIIINGTLQISISYHNYLYEKEEIMELQHHYFECLRETIKQLAQEKSIENKQVDFDFKGINKEEIKGIINLL